MKVVFLDIDGVLKEESYKAAFQDECFARLKRIIDATDAQIILTSSWRVNYWKFVEDGFQTENEDVLRLHEYFEKYGLKVSGRTDLTVACHAKRKKLTRKTKKTLLNTTFKSVFYYL